MPGTANIALTGTSGALTHSASVSLTIAPTVTTASLSTPFFDFGHNLVNNTLTKTVVVVTNTEDANINIPWIFDPSKSTDRSE
jgi:hypothetical protein